MNPEQNQIREGKVFQFGGYDKKKNKTKEYGFLQDSEFEDNVYFHKSDIVNEDDKHLLELESDSDLGKGIVINYRIDLNTRRDQPYAYEVKAKRVVNFSLNPLRIQEYYVRLHKDGELNYFNSKILNIDVAENRDKIINFSSQLNQEKFRLLLRYIINNNHFKYLPELLENFLTVNEEEIDVESKLNSLITGYPVILSTCPNYVYHLTYESLTSIATNKKCLDLDHHIVDEIISLILKKNQADNILSPDENQNRLVKIVKFSKPFLGRLAEKTELWKELLVEDLTYLYSYQKDSIPKNHYSLFIDIVKNKLKKDPNAATSESWEVIKELKDSVEEHGELWDIAPDFVKADVLRQRYQKFLQLVEDWKNYKPEKSNSIEISCRSAYKFEDSDIALVNKWIGDAKVTNEQFITATMFSARGAEKAAILHYEKRDLEVVDTSIHQQTKDSNDWKLYDLQVSYPNQTKCIDIKNARSTYNDTNRFSEFCVPRFKKRKNQEIIIVGVFSPYIAKLSEDYEDYREQKKITILGETQESLLQKLKNRCQDKFRYLDLDLTIERESKNNLNKTLLSEYLPVWAFDYDEEFYLSISEIEKRYRELDNKDIPSLSELKLLYSDGKLPLSLSLCSSQSFPSHWKQELEKDIINFAIILRYLVGEENRVTLAHIFLTILIHFLDNCRQSYEDFNPKIYKDIIFNQSPSTMGVYDPLSFIFTMCETLEKIWDKCREELLNFNSFTFDSRGLLKGKDKNTNTSKTILAYCGGWLQDKQGKPIAPCGNQNLFIGKNDKNGKNGNCTSCHRLICDKCGFCKDDCEEYNKRKPNYYKQRLNRT